MKYIRSGESLKDTINFLLKEIESVGLKIKGLYLDREFSTVEVINHLQEKQTPFIMPCIPRGRSGGIRNLFKGEKATPQNIQCVHRKEKPPFKSI
ncbi:MAG: hypothetical protein FJ150_07580 [Euryarchaeota archaeon]|nr:hypothetical protein [Euryarchaeota archaeon]